jgi:predicted nucleotidyltransferase
MLKNGKYRAFRNIPVGWLLQAIHSTDLSERLFRILFAIFMLIVVWYCCFQGIKYSFIYAFGVSHTLCWLLTGNFWVYMLDSFLFVKNPGIDSLIGFLKKSKKAFAFLECCDAILVYGSMCRGMFHIRSDLDLRIVRRSDSRRGVVALSIGLFFRIYSFFKIIPVDLEVVDSMAFLRHQMRDDEVPIVVYLRPGASLDISGQSFEDIVMNPDSVLKENVA